MRGADGTLADVAPEDARDARARIVHPRRGRPDHRAGAARRAGRRHRARARRRADGGRRLEEDAATGCSAIVAELDARPPPMPPEELAEGKAFLRWLADDHFTFLGYRCHDLVVGRRPGRAAGSSRARASASCARTPSKERRDELRRAAAGGARLRARARPADRHQGERALDRAPPGLSRLRRRQALRRRGQRLRRASLPRPVHVDRLQRQPGRHSAAAAQDRQRRRARGRRARQPRRQGAAQHPRRPIRATSCSRRARTTCCARRWASCISASGSASGCSCGAIRSSASSSCLIYAPRENYTTELRAEVAGDPDRRRSTARARNSTCTCRSRCWRAS